MKNSGTTENIISWLFSDAGSAVLAGALGGLTRWLTLRDSWREGVTAVLVGAICALYLGPLVEPVLEPMIGKIAPGEDASGFASFICGLAGISLAGLLIDVFNARRRQVAKDKTEDA